MSRYNFSIWIFWAMVNVSFLEQKKAFIVEVIRKQSGY